MSHQDTIDEMKAVFCFGMAFTLLLELLVAGIWWLCQHLVWVP